MATENHEINRVRKVINNCIDSAEADGIELKYNYHTYRDLMTVERMAAPEPICGCLIGCVLGDLPDNKLDGQSHGLPFDYKHLAAERLGISNEVILFIEQGFENEPCRDILDGWYKLGEEFRALASDGENNILHC